LTLLSPPQKAIRNDLDVILIFGAIPGQKASDGCPHRKFVGGDFAYTGREHDDLANGEFVAHAAALGLLAKLEIDG
jgi:hypothetical protein